MTKKDEVNTKIITKEKKTKAVKNVNKEKKNDRRICDANSTCFTVYSASKAFGTVLHRAYVNC